MTFIFVYDNIIIIQRITVPVDAKLPMKMAKKRAWSVICVIITWSQVRCASSMLRGDLRDTSCVSSMHTFHFLYISGQRCALCEHKVVKGESCAFQDCGCKDHATQRKADSTSTSLFCLVIFVTPTLLSLSCYMDGFRLQARTHFHSL